MKTYYSDFNNTAGTAGTSLSDFGSATFNELVASASSYVTTGNYVVGVVVIDQGVLWKCIANNSHPSNIHSPPVLPTTADGFWEYYGSQGTFTWIVYANSADGTVDFTTGAYNSGSIVRKYIGVAYNKANTTESTNPAHYTWSKFIGDDGATGPVGPSPLTVSLTKPAVSIATDADGLNQVYLTSGDSRLTTLEGSTPLVYDGVGTSNGKWKITSAIASTVALSGVSITGTAGQFSCSAASVTLAVNTPITITGATALISGHTNPKTYYIIATNGTTTFTLSATLGGAAITTTVGTPGTLTYNVWTIVPGAASAGPAGAYATYTAASSMIADTASIEYTVEGTNGSGVTFTGIKTTQTFSKVRGAVVDTIAPGTPTGLAFNPSTGTLITTTNGDIQVKLAATWTANAEADFSYYIVAIQEASGTFIEFVTTSNSYDWLVKPNTSYTVKVKAVDSSNNRSAFCTPVSVTTIRDTTPPAPPTGLTATATFKSVYLSWTNASASDLAYVKIYEATTSTGTYIVVGTVAASASSAGTFTRSGLSAGATRFYKLTSVDTSGNESSLSGVTITGTAGQFSCSTASLAIGASVAISGTFGGTGSIAGYTNPTTYYIIATNGSTTFTLSTTSGGAAVATTAGTPTGLTYRLFSSIVSATTEQVANVDIQAGAIDALSMFTTGIQPVVIVPGSTVPTTNVGRSILLEGTGKLYRWDTTLSPDAYTAAVEGSDIVANSITAGQIAAGAISATEIASNAITTSKLIMTGSNVIPNSDFATGDFTNWRTFGTIPSQSVIASSITTTAMSGTGSVATLTFATQPYAPFSAGDTIYVTGAVPSGYNGTFTVLASPAPSTTSVSYTSTATGAQTTAATISNFPSTALTDVPTANVAKYSYSGAAATVSTFSHDKAYADNGADQDGFAVDEDEEYSITIHALKNAAYAAADGLQVSAYFYKSDGTHTTNRLCTLTPIVNTTAASGTGTVATISFPTQSVAPYAIGDTIKVSGVTPLGYNGTYVVTAATASSVSYEDNATGAQTVAGTVTLLSRGAVVTTTGASATGGTATITFTAQTVAPYLVGDTITVSGITPLAYNGTYLVTAATTSSVSYASSATGSQSVAGTINLEAGPYRASTIAPSDLSSTLWTQYIGKFTVPAGASRCWLYIRDLNHTAGNLYWTKVRAIRRNNAQVIVDGSITSSSMNANTISGRVIRAGTLHADKIVAGSLTADKIAVPAPGNFLDPGIFVDGTGTTLGTVRDRAADPAARINTASTSILPGKILIDSGTSTNLTSWIGGPNNTEINGASIAANTITANKLTIGMRGIDTTSITFEAERNSSNVPTNVVTWTAGNTIFTTDNGVSIARQVDAGSATWSGGTVYLYWVKPPSTVTTYSIVGTTVTLNYADQGYVPFNNGELIKVYGTLTGTNPPVGSFAVTSCTSTSLTYTVPLAPSGTTGTISLNSQINYATTRATATRDNTILLATFVGLSSPTAASVTNLTTKIGKTTIDGNNITTGSVKAEVLAAESGILNKLYLGSSTTPTFTLDGNAYSGNKPLMTITDPSLNPLVRIGYLDSSNVGFELKNTSGATLLSTSTPVSSIDNGQTGINLANIVYSQFNQATLPTIPTTSSTGTFSVVLDSAPSPAAPVSGLGSIRINTGASSICYAYLAGTFGTYNIVLKPNTTYLYSAYVKAATASVAGQLRIRLDDVGTDATTSFTTSGTANTWTRVSTTFTTNSGTTSAGARVANTTSSSSLWFTGIMIEEARGASATVPSPYVAPSLNGLITSSNTSTYIASLKADVIQLDNLTLDTDGSGNLKIKALGVDTAYITDNAVSNVQSAYTSGAISCPENATTTVQTRSLSSIGKPVLVMLSLTAVTGTAPAYVAASIYRDSTLIWNSAAFYVASNGGFSLPLAYQFVDTPTGSLTNPVTYSYTLRVSVSAVPTAGSPIVSATSRTLSVVELKK